MPEILIPPILGPDMAGGWGLEARHTWDDRLTLGALTALPQYKLTAINGLRNLGDFAAPAEQATGRRGEVPRSGYRGGKTVVYNGRVRARSLADLRRAEEELLAATDTTTELEMVITPHPSYASGSRSFLARCVECEIPDEQVYGPHRVGTLGYERDFSLTLRLSDPRIFDKLQRSGVSGVGAAAAINLATNPRGASGLATGWVANGMDYFAPASPLPVAAGLPAGIDTGFGFVGSAVNDWEYLPVDVIAGSVYVVSLYVLLTRRTAAGLALLVQNAAGSSTYVTGATYATLGPWTRLAAVFTAPATESARVGLLQVGAGILEGYVTGLQVELGTVASDYHDGDSPLSGWTGTASESTSSRRARRDVAVFTGAGLGRDVVEADPVVTIAGDASDPVLRHRGLDRYLSFEGHTIEAGQSLDVDFNKRSILLNGTTPVPDWLDRATSDWWDEGVPGLLPGANVVELYRTGAGEATVAWRDAYPA